MTSQQVVIVGSGQGGFQVAASLRDMGFDGHVTIVGEESGLPYQRPPLSKAFLTGQMQHEHLLLRPASFFESRKISLIAPERVQAIARDKREVVLQSGRCFHYDHLVLATGARARPVKVPGAEQQRVVLLRGLADAIQVRAWLQRAQRIVIIGAGFIGLEIAAIAAAMGIETDVLDFAERGLKRSVSAFCADFLATAHATAGVRFHFSTAIAHISGSDGIATGVVSADGRHFAADMVLVGIGVEPNTELAQEAGLEVSNGIVVDCHLQTADPAISAIGDCALYPSAFFPRPMRIESVQNAVDQARCVASRIAGKPASYHKVPWFWSDQGAYKLQIAGVASEADQAVLRGDMSTGKFSVFRFHNGRLTAVESINRPGDHLAARKLIEAGTLLSHEQAADDNFKLNQRAA
ncbi:NAD(P)/FAD-dependent oxidoreductase [Noviherbaspirillum suwonense]|uniref:3-phenylpropionate/trans-cinnamate dioxygenase ferredoxin reductase subunit n=1 Tax=Noviherbaspirillum suwonense TaxID=1224511 RepID=A0ABY1QJ48_9BURK|nr:FAD-dependent oxidoreductase [Noviherbaspirillum suwonense]SMP72831.1 3-phenylpropionate/trans-cinnamate dioxygenase ferredoxin reductase subunit [Noviherbaspirillum suwonense]